MEKEFRMYVTNITQAITVLREAGITALSNGTFIRLSIPEEKKTEVILLLNKEKVVVYDIEEI
jgi:hypothetical protein